MANNFDTEAFAALLYGTYVARDAEMRAGWKRSLPFGDTMFDRWDRAERLGFGKGTSIYQSAHVFGDVSIGENVWVGPWVMLDGSGGLKIGDFVSISAGVQIYTHDTVHWALSGGELPARKGNVEIGSQVYIGCQSIIARGVSIGDRSVIAANSLVLDDVPDSCIFGGSPAKKIGKVEGVGSSVQLKFFHKDF